MQPHQHNQKKDSVFAQNIYNYPNTVVGPLLNHYYRRLQEESKDLDILRFSDVTDAQGNPKIDAKHVFTRSDNKEVLMVVKTNEKGFTTIWTT